ncbi:VanZ family protein [Streptomyces sp. NPDC019890]|uniref:VanZ family protein n=1 Tax=Streptomyces sp. NPDC019890 TaxID=3365064 RepID=UPI00384ADC93
MIEAVLRATPLFWPGALLSALAGLLCSRRLGRRLGAHPLAAFLLVLALGGIATFTLLPDINSHYLDSLRYAEGGYTAQWHAPRLAELTSVNQNSLNVALFVPLGVAVAHIRPGKAAAWSAVAAAALPFGIEATQYAVPWLLRAADLQDIVDNLLGLALGLFAGHVLGLVARAAAPLRRARNGPPRGSLGAAAQPGP